MTSERTGSPVAFGAPALARIIGLVALAVALVPPTSSAVPIDSGVSGIVRGAACTVTREGRSCSARPASTTVEAYRPNGDGPVAAARVGPLGAFRLGLEPGAYVLRLAPSPGTRLARGRDVRVRPHEFTLVVLQLQSRVR
jgi:hypothetical protein